MKDQWSPTQGYTFPWLLYAVCGEIYYLLVKETDHYDFPGLMPHTKTKG